MPSIFKMVTGKVVSEFTENGDLIPIRNLIDADKFHCCSLVCKKKSFFPFFKPHYWKTGLTVDDLLEASDELDCVFTEVAEKKNSKIKDNVKMKMRTEMNIPHVTSVNGEVDFSTKLELKLKFWEISHEGKESLSQRKLKKELPSLVEALKKRGENLYMVIETVELDEEQNIERKYFVGTSFKSLIMKIEGLLDVNISSAVTIPSKSVLACRTNLLVFEEKHCRISHFDDENSFSSAMPTEEWLEPLESFSDLQEKVMNLIWALQDLTETQRKAVLDLLTRLLQDEALGEMEGKVAMALFTEELSDPENPLLSVLFDASGSSMQKEGEGILDFLEALTELKEDQQKILPKVVEERLLSETIKLVEDLLKQSETFPLKTDSITHTLVRLCDPECKLEQPVTWDSETCHSLCVLYTVLSVLKLLAQDSSSVL
ncbi:gasdermin-B isoform X2 [Antechinus flavipes]|uniref:gasdermin-B isoform X2 n=1 Tax=Antechinus flavipes TaxID=38775 RepID=UPI0022354F63|nr:gasdermin-B isoform X2 [Antechinus flavipes]